MGGGKSWLLAHLSKIRFGELFGQGDPPALPQFRGNVAGGAGCELLQRRLFVFADAIHQFRAKRGRSRRAAISLRSFGGLQEGKGTGQERGRGSREEAAGRRPHSQGRRHGGEATTAASPTLPAPRNTCTFRGKNKPSVPPKLISLKTSPLRLILLVYVHCFLFFPWPASSSNWIAGRRGLSL